ncbi:MAG: hypothetical protein OXG62_03035 [Nitrospinae bacterium]|nr:hypothetical protein [Nitrospinota bacterium]
MLRFLRLAVCVACIAAFASGCGGGGGAAAPVMECPQGQVGTYPDCMDPPPTDEQRIADAREEIAGIVNQANAIEQAARSAVTAVESNPDATDEDIADARFHGNAALDALREIIRTSGVANAATTGAQAEGAVASANAALGRLNVARTEAVGIRSRVEAVGNLREQQAEEDRLATNGSSLIQHVRENKKVFDAVLESLSADSITVGATSTANQATFHFHTGDTPTVYPRPQDTERDVRTVTITVGGGGSALSSTSKTAKLTGTGRLPHGFDLKNADGTQFANAYTDISVAQQVRAKNAAGDDVAMDTNADDDVDERYQYAADADYLLAGIWLNDSAGATAPLGAFAYGSQAIATSGYNFCTAADVADATNAAGEVTLTRSCGITNGLHTITTLVDTAKDKSATYRGDANGAYLAGGAMSYFTADVELTAEFVNVDGTLVTGSKISGAVTDIVAGGKSIAGSIDLKEVALIDDISGPFGGANGADAAGVIAGNAYIGTWKGQFFGMRYDKRSEATDTSTTPATRTTTYTPGLPDAVAGTFYVEKQSAPAGDAALIGSFGARR